MASVLNLATNLFPVWVLLGCGLALWRPPLFTWFHGQMIVWGLAMIMLGMGMTLRVDDFKAVLKMPKAVGMGLLAQYMIMPGLGWGIAKMMHLEDAMAVGLILVACCPGGTASNVVVFLARCNVALSVLMTMCSTFVAILATPFLTEWLAGQYVPVPAWKLFQTTLQVVLLPLVLGISLNHFFFKSLEKIKLFSPFISVIFIMLICASIMGQRAGAVKASALELFLSVFFLHIGAFTIGYLFAKLLGYDELVRRTISIEVGMQNSGLGTVLAEKHFTHVLTPLPCAISAMMHSVIGSALAGFWRWREIVKGEKEA